MTHRYPHAPSEYEWVCDTNKIGLLSTAFTIGRHDTDRKNQPVQVLVIEKSDSPVLIVGDGRERGVQAVHVEGHVTLVTQQLLVWVLLDATRVAVAPAAVLFGVVLAVLALWPVGPCRTEEVKVGQHKHNSRFPKDRIRNKYYWQHIP